VSEAPAPVTLPRIGDPAPTFEAESTQGVISLDSYPDKWIVLFSHPGDFTPVCTTEFVEFARRKDDFDKRNVQLVGISVDSLFSHLAWVNSIEENQGVHIPFPVIADLDTKVSQAYGMIHANQSTTSTVRAVFVIDPKRTVRAIIYYPMQAGRNIDEIVRLVDALQTGDANTVSTPANWVPGQPVVVGAPRTQEALAARKADDKLDKKGWYLATKSL